MRPSIILAVMPCAVVLCACSNASPAEEGVNVFSADTAPARIMVDVSGTLEVGLRSDVIMTTHDKRIVLETPASLLFEHGAGDIIVHSVDTTQRIVLESMQTPPDSAENAGATGLVVTATRVAGAHQPRFRVERP